MHARARLSHHMHGLTCGWTCGIQSPTCHTTPGCIRPAGANDCMHAHAARGGGYSVQVTCTMMAVLKISDAALSQHRWPKWGEQHNTTHRSCIVGGLHWHASIPRWLHLQPPEMGGGALPADASDGICISGHVVQRACSPHRDSRVAGVEERAELCCCLCAADCSSASFLEADALQRPCDVGLQVRVCVLQAGTCAGGWLGFASGDMGCREVAGTLG